MPADGTFHQSDRGTGPAQPVGPGSNTGQKSPVTTPKARASGTSTTAVRPEKSSLTAPIIDYCTAVLDSEKAKKLFRAMSMTDVLRYVFGTGTAIAVGPLQERVFNFYQRSATMVDATGSVCGKIGLRDDGAIQISLTGQGCQHVPSFPQVADRLDDLGARCSRLDIAVDDLTGDTFDIQTFLDLYDQGEFTTNGRPPLASFVSDCGSNKGCSFYVGQKGHKQLNIYEKGKQLGDPESKHTRCELRLYAKRIDLPNDALRDPGKYFGAAYPLLEAFVVGEVERLGIKEQIINATTVAAVRFLRTQAGTTLNAFLDALGEEEGMEFIRKSILRTDRPGRWKHITGDLSAHIRAQLQQSLEEEPSL